MTTDTPIRKRKPGASKYWAVLKKRLKSDGGGDRTAVKSGEAQMCASKLEGGEAVAKRARLDIEIGYGCSMMSMFWRSFKETKSPLIAALKTRFATMSAARMRGLTFESQNFSSTALRALKIGG